MRLNQNETARKRSAESLERRVSRVATQHTAHAAFTLTELLVVITIIAILAGLITAAAVNAFGKGKQTAITFELQQIAGAIEEFKNLNGVYPPNVYEAADLTNNNETNQNASNLLLTLKRVSSRGTEFNADADPATAGNNVTTILQAGLTPAEALVFWLSGFSEDTKRPLSGFDLEVVSIDDNGTPINNVITFDAFPNPLYEFDTARLRFSRDNTTGNRRFLTVHRTDGTEVYIQLYEYVAQGSEQPFVYFDTSRDSPFQMVNNWQYSEPFYDTGGSNGNIFPLKQVRPDAPDGNLLQNLEYVNEGTFQLLHCGIDDLWGDFSSGGRLDVSNSNPNSTTPHNVALLFPDGPFLGEVADTVGNFMTGTLADKQE